MLYVACGTPSQGGIALDVVDERSIFCSGETGSGKSESRCLASWHTARRTSQPSPRRQDPVLLSRSARRHWRSLQWPLRRRCHSLRAAQASAQIRWALQATSCPNLLSWLLAAILHLGDVEFTIDRGRGVDVAAVRNADVLGIAAEFLGSQPSVRCLTRPSSSRRSFAPFSWTLMAPLTAVTTLPRRSTLCFSPGSTNTATTPLPGRL